MFKETFPENFKIYQAACKRGEVRTGIVLRDGAYTVSRGPRYGLSSLPIGNISRRRAVRKSVDLHGLRDIRFTLRGKGIRLIALPPLGSGNGGLDWKEVRSKIELAFANMLDTDVIVYEPTGKYQNVAKRTGVEKLTAARALIAELVRRYWVLGFECSLLEIQKLAYFLENSIEVETASKSTQFDIQRE